MKSSPNSKKAQFIKHEMLEMSKEDVVENIAMAEADFDGQEIKMNIIVNCAFELTTVSLKKYLSCVSPA